MGSDDWPDWLPGDWTVYIRKINGQKVKCYAHPEGHKCYSKSEVLDCLKKMNKSADNSTIDLSVDPNADTNKCSESLPEEQPTKLTPRSSGRRSHSRDLSEDALAGGGVESSEPLSSQRQNKDSWLPEGWTVEVKVRKDGSKSGMRYKCYVDPISGQKFFSKPQVLNHLAKTNRSAGGQKAVSSEPISVTPISAWQEKSTTDPDNSQTYEATKVKKSRTGKKTHSSRFSSKYEVISRTDVEGLPTGWIKEVRARKHGPASKTDPYYLDPLSEYAFFSKKDALRYLESGDINKCVMRPVKRDVNNDDTRNVNLSSSKEELTSPDPSKESPNGFVEELKTNESGILNPKPIRSITGGVYDAPKEENTDWLPDGWVVEMLYRNSGMKCKVFKETASGKKFYSKPQVLSYLADGNNSYSRKRKLDSSSNSAPADATRPKRSGKKNVIQKSDCQEVITTSPADGLPPGWIKEIRTKIYATHKRSDPFYTDPVTGYIFRSKLDAERFLDTGDVNLCAMRPKIKDKDGKEVYVYTHDEQKQVKRTTGRLFVDKEDDLSTENHEESQITDPETADNTKNNKPISSITGGVYNAPKEENTDWLPDGWVVEMLYRNSGMKCKVFKETATGKKLYSKPQVLSYLADGSNSYSRKRKLDSSSNSAPADATRPKRSGKKNVIQKSDCQEVITTSPADGLPPGWIKEIRTKIYATHKRSDPFYIDPVTGYIFRSNLDAKRFLDTGDVNLCAMRPKVKDKDGKEVYVYTHDEQKQAKRTTGRLFVDKEDDLSTENHEESQITEPETADNTKNKVSSKITKCSDPQVSQPARSSKRQKGMDPDPTSTEGSEGVQVKQAAWVNLEKLPADDANMSYEIPEDDNWTDHCIDFTVKTLADEILFNGQPMSGGFQEEKNESPTKVK